MVTVTELNRAPNGRFESLEATGSFTDPAGISYSGAINPVQVTEEASTFTESDVTVTHNNTTVSSESIELDLATVEVIDDFEDGDITTESSDWDGWNGDTGSLTAQSGTVINGSITGELTSSNENASINTDRGSNTTNDIKFSIQIGNDTGNSSDFVQAQFYSANQNTFYDRLRFYDSDNIEFGGTEVRSSWTAGVTYEIVMSFDFSSDSVQIFINGTDEGSYSLGGSGSGLGNLEFENATFNSAATRELYIDNVGVLGVASSGDALVEWDSGVPADLDSYDLATFQRTLDSETVTIDVEDGNGNVLFSDISQNFDISTVDTSKEVKLRANISRTDTSNNPTVDYLARRFNRS